MVTIPEAERIIKLGTLKARCRALGITHDRIARLADVSRPAVVNVFAGRTTSANILAVAERLCAREERRRQKAQAIA